MYYKLNLPFRIGFAFSLYKDGVENNRWLGIYGNVIRVPVKFKGKRLYGTAAYLELDILCYRMTLSLEQRANIHWSKK